MSSGEEHGEGEGEDEDDGEDAAYGEEDDRGGDRTVNFCDFDPANSFDYEWSDFKYPVAKHFVPRFREAHAMAAMFHLNDDLAAKFPDLNGQINEGWQAHFQRPIHVEEILQPPRTGKNGYNDEEMHWLQQTVRYYVSGMPQGQLDETGISSKMKSRILKFNQVRSTRPWPHADLWPQYRDPSVVYTGDKSIGEEGDTSSRPKERGCLEIECQKG